MAAVGGDTGGAIITRLSQITGWIFAFSAVLLVVAALSVRSASAPAATAPSAQPDAPPSKGASVTAVEPEPTRMPERTARATPTTQPATLPPTPSPTTVSTPAPVAVNYTTSAPIVSASPVPAPSNEPTPVPVADPNPVLLTESRVTGSLGRTLILEGYSAMVRPKAAATTSQCADAHPDFVVFELVVTFTDPFSGPHFGSAGSVDSCMDGPAFPLVSGAIYEVFLPQASASPVTLMLNPNSGAHTLIFEFN